MAALSLEERMLDLMEQADALAVGFLRLDADIRALARVIAEKSAEERRAARTEALRHGGRRRPAAPRDEPVPTTAPAPVPGRRLTATPPKGR